MFSKYVGYMVTQNQLPLSHRAMVEYCLSPNTWLRGLGMETESDNP